MIREARAQRPNGAHALFDHQRCAGLQPMYAGIRRYLCHVQGIVNRMQVE
jgi:hypothetical protein